MTPFDHLLHRARVTKPVTPLDAWISDKRDEAQRLHRASYQDWIKQGLNLSLGMEGMKDDLRNYQGCAGPTERQ